MPALGQTSDELRLITWLKAEGEQVTEGEPLLEIETDKTDARGRGLRPRERCCGSCAAGARRSAPGRWSVGSASRARTSRDEPGGPAETRISHAGRRSRPPPRPSSRGVPRRPPARSPASAASTWRRSPEPARRPDRTLGRARRSGRADPTHADCGSTSAVPRTAGRSRRDCPAPPSVPQFTLSRTSTRAQPSLARPDRRGDPHPRAAPGGRQRRCGRCRGVNRVWVDDGPRFLQLEHATWAWRSPPTTI